MFYQTRMATAPSNLIPEQVKEIAQAAINSINQLTLLIEHGPSSPTSGTLRIPTNANVAD